MTFVELKRANPELHSQLLEACAGNVFLASRLYTEALAEGVAKERARCAAHLEIAERTGNRQVAFAAIESGVTAAELAASYTTAPVNTKEGAG